MLQLANNIFKLDFLIFLCKNLLTQIGDHFLSIFLRDLLLARSLFNLFFVLSLDFSQILLLLLEVLYLLILPLDLLHHLLEALKLLLLRLYGRVFRLKISLLHSLILLLLLVQALPVINVFLQLGHLCLLLSSRLL